MIDMKVAKVKVIGSGKPEDPFRVNLPTYGIIPGSEVYDKSTSPKMIECDVEVPDDEVDKDGQLDKVRIRKKYAGQPKWDHDKVLEDLF